MTGPRVAILAALELDRMHPTAEELCLRLRRRHLSLSVSTVYLTLKAFARAGLIRRLSARDGQLRVDGNVSNHDHAICRSCGTIRDLPRAPTLKIPPPDGLPDGARVLDARVEYEVICARCQRGHPIRSRRPRRRQSEA